MSPLVKLFTSSDNILVRQLSLWDLCVSSLPLPRAQGRAMPLAES